MKKKQFYVKKKEFRMTKTKSKKKILSCLLIFSLLLSGCSGDLTSDGEEEAAPGEYGIMVINQNGEAVSDASVTLNGETKITESNGYVVFERPSTDVSSLNVTCLDYYDYQKNNYRMKDGASDSITIRAKSLQPYRLKSAVYTNGLYSCDLLENYKKVNMSTPDGDFDISVSVLGDSDHVKKYELHQEVDSTDKIIATSTNGIFSQLKVKDFSVGTNVYVTVFDNGNHPVSTNLNLEIGEDPNYQEYSELSLGDGISFEVSDDVAIFGGTSFHLGVPGIPLDYKLSGDKIHIGFNVDEDTFDDDSQMKEYKKLLNEVNRVNYTSQNYKRLIQQLKKRQKKKGLMNMSGFDNNIELTISGYAEAGFDSSGKLSTGTGYLCVTASASAEFDWQLVVWCVPVIVDVTGKITADVAGAVSYDFSENTLSGDVSLKISPSLEVKAGVGFKYLSAGVYGSAGLETKLILAGLTEKPGFDYLDMTSTIGVYAKAAFLEPEKDLLTGTFNLWTRSEENRKKSAKKTGNAQQGEESADTNIYGKLYDISSYSPISKADCVTMKTVPGSEQDILSSGLHFGAAPVSESNGNTALTVFSSQIKMDDAENSYSKLYYSYYCDGSWSDSVLLDGEINNEMNPEIYCDGEDYYLIYQEDKFDYSLFDDYAGRTDEEKIKLLEQAFQNVDIHVKMFDDSTQSFVDLGCIETKDIYDYNASIVVKDRIPYVYSAANKDGDFFGNGLEKSNSLYRSRYENGKWIKEEVETGLNSITQLRAGVFSDKVSCVYTVEGDNDLSTVDDLVTYCSCDNLSQKIKEGRVTQLQYDSLPAKQSSGYLLADDAGLYALNDKLELVTVLEDSGNYTGEYFVSGRAVYYIKRTGDGTEIYACYPLPQDSYSNPVQITSEGKWQRNLAPVTIDGKELIIGLSDTYDADGNEVDTELISRSVSDFSDLAIDDVTIDFDDIQTEGEVPVSVTLTNKGNQVIPREKLLLMDDNGSELAILEDDYSAAMVPGQSVTYHLHVVTTDSTEYGRWKVEAAIVGPNVSDDENQEEVFYAETDMDNNSYTVTSGHSDFVLSTKLYDSGAYPYLMIEVKNDGNISDSAKVEVVNANDITQELNSYSLSSLAAGHTKIFKMRLQESWADLNGKVSVLVQVSDAENEVYTYNNFAYEYATMNYGTYQISYNLDGGENSSENPFSYTTADNVVLAEAAKSGYSFAGWYSSPDFDTITRISEIPAGSAGDISLYAKWVKKEPASTPVPSKEDQNKNKYDTSRNDVDMVTGRPPEKGTKWKDKTGAAYLVTYSDTAGGTAAYLRPGSKKVAAVSIPSTVKYGKYVFQVTAVSPKAFMGCKRLKEVTIGKNIRRIGKKAFYGCGNLKKITIKTVKLTSKSIGIKAFGKLNARAVLQVPKKKWNVYKKLLKRRGVTGKKQRIIKR